MRHTYFLAIAIILTSCTAAKISVPAKFESQASRMPVKGVNGWQVNQKLSFGNFQTSAVKRGWDFSAGMQHSKLFLQREEILLNILGINTDKRSFQQRNKFQYSIADGTTNAAVYATELYKEKQLVYNSSNPAIGSASKTNSYDYIFTAAIVPEAVPAENAWQLSLQYSYDRKKDTAVKLFDRSYVYEEGYATNGKEKISIRPLRIENVTTATGKQTKVAGGNLFSGYELQWDGGLVAIVDILDSAVWMYNDLDAADKMILSSIASALLLKRLHDVEADNKMALN